MGVDCTAVRYHCTKRPDVDLCPAAFAEGRFPAGTCAADFVRIDGGAAAAGQARACCPCSDPPPCASDTRCKGTAALQL